MTLEQALEKLRALGTEQVRVRNARNGVGDNQYGVKLGDIRKVAKEAKSDHKLALALWETGNIEARLLATLVIRPGKLSSDELDGMVRSLTWTQVADWLNAYVVRRHPGTEALREGWMDAVDPWAARAGWNLTAERVAKNPEGLALEALLDRIESEMGDAAPEAQWTMINTLAAIGIHHPGLRERAIEIGEALGAYRDYPTSKGCTSPFAPIWINEMVSRQR